MSHSLHLSHRIWIIASLYLAYATVVISQTPMVDGDDGKLIEDAFKRMKIKTPQLGWILPNGDVVTEIAAKEITIIARNSNLQIAPQIGIIPAKEVPAFIRKNQVDCDQIDEKAPQPIYRYTAKMPTSKFASQVLVVPRLLSAEIKSGHEEFKPTDMQLKPLWKEMKLLPGQKHLLHAIRQANDGQQSANFFFSYVTTYGKNGVESRQGVFLQDQTGKILGRQIEDLDEDHACDGCGLSTYEDDRHLMSLSVNLISIATLPYPMVLQDSSTIEGRAIDLFTFSASGQPSHYRPYEYMVTCILGSDPH